MTSIALYTLASEYQAAAAQLADLDLPTSVINDTLEGLAGDLEAKAQNIGRLLRSWDATIGAMSAEEAAMKKRRESTEKRREYVAEYLKATMERCNIPKIDGAVRLAIRTNPPALHIDDPAQIPDEYWMQPPLPPREIAKATLKGVLMSGQEIPGAHVAQGTRLEIKI